MASEACKKFIKTLCEVGKVEIGTPKGVLTVEPRGEFYLFLTSCTQEEIKEILGNQLYEKIKDMIHVPVFTSDEIGQMIEQLLQALVVRCKEELKVNLHYTEEFKTFLMGMYHAEFGINAINMLIESKVYESISESKVKGKITEKTTVVVTVSEGKMALVVNGEVIIIPEEEASEMLEKADALRQKISMNIVGEASFKEYLIKLFDHVKAQRIRKRAGMKVLRLDINLVFEGNPGTGKSIAAKALGEYLNALGILEKGHVVEVNKADLIGSFKGESVQKVQEVVNHAQGGVLLINDAFALARRK